MNTRQVTRHEIKNASDFIVCIPQFYGQYLTQYTSLFGFGAGVYGWNFDCFIIQTDKNLVAVTYGDRPIGKNLDYSDCEKAGKKAQKICGNFKLTYKQRKYFVNLLLKNLLIKLGY